MDRESQRKKFFIDVGLQMKVLGFAFLTLILLLATVFLSLDRGLDEVAETTQQYYLHVDMVQRAIQGPMVVSAVISIIAGLLITFFWFHRFIGPIKALEVGMKRIENGDLSTDVRTRETDFLKDTVRNFNAMRKELKSKIHQDRERLDGISQKIAEISRRDCPQPIQEPLKKVREELQKITSQFKTSAPE